MVIMYKVPGWLNNKSLDLAAVTDDQLVAYRRLASQLEDQNDQTCADLLKRHEALILEAKTLYGEKSNVAKYLRHNAVISRPPALNKAFGKLRGQVLEARKNEARRTKNREYRRKYDARKRDENSRINAAYQYWTRGWSIIPIRPRDKLPFDEIITTTTTANSWRTYQGRRPTEDELFDWWKACKNMNIAVVTGEISGVLVLDVDQPSGDHDQLPAFLPSDLVIPKVRTARGYHLYFKHPGIKLSNANKPFEWMDVRSDTGYAILPPSTHESGVQYTWEVPLGDELPDIPTDLLALLKERAGEFVEETGLTWSGHDDDDNED